MEVVMMVVGSVARTLMDRHDVRERDIKDPVEGCQDLFENFCKRALFGGGEVGERLQVPFSGNMHLVWISRKKRNVGHKAFVLSDEPLFEDDLFRCNIAQQTSA